MSIEAGTLYVVATPIGNLEDMSPRARRVLAEVELIAAEDTRHSAVLLRHFNITTPMTALHEHNEGRAAERLLERLNAGASVALISDAGTPLISDPGYVLVREAHARAVPVVPIPGPSAVMAALCVAGLPTDRFVFEGFLPAKAGARRQAIARLAAEPGTLVFYEAPHRLLDTLADLRAGFGDARRVTLARELTKTFETVRADTLAGLEQWVAADPDQRRGEAVLVVAGAPGPDADELDDEQRRLMDLLLAELPVKRAAALAARIGGGKKNQYYRYALERGDG